ncbi:uncharacterized protein HD556DRAFT_1445468 [Suillus plorans]|uniref:Uncharacterized protein n=1 Tax=Suillus plorans TaxID=116603 RepID=A0A9P7ALW7_9AGAM|nr:uncharacterized protein HD556DRAFT_1445468 [Suillus plorans]KAG1791202.1 hypothetical protein HD556DRAFT_1445468 [Suillus plorans]
MTEVSVNPVSSSTETSTDSDVVQDIRDKQIKPRVFEMDAINEVKDKLRKAHSLFDRVRGGRFHNMSGVAALAVLTVASLATLFFGKLQQRLTRVPAQRRPKTSTHEKEDLFSHLSVNVTDNGFDIHDGLSRYFDDVIGYEDSTSGKSWPDVKTVHKG